MRFKVRFVHPAEMTLRQEVLEAPDEQALRARLGEQGMVVLEVGRALALPRLRARSRRREYPLLCRELRTLIRAGMTVVEGVDTLCARDRGAADSLAGLLRERLLQGQALSQALAALPDAPPVLVAAVRAGERTSNLAEALDDYLRFDDLVQRLRQRVVSASIYPALVTTLGIGITLFLLVVVLPSFSRMYQNLRGRSGGLSAWMVDISLWVEANRMETFGGLALAALAAAVWVHSGAASRWAGEAAMRSPWLRQRIRDFQLAMLYQAIALLLRGGYPMMQALQVANQSALAGQHRQALASAQRQIAEGGLVSAALFGAGLCDEVDRRLMAAAERNGQFHMAAEVVSRMHGERFELFVERVTRIVEPILLLGVALMVGSVVVAMYLPVFDMATRLR